MATRVLVTRPVREALRWTAKLQAHGFAAQALPLIDIVPAEPAPLVAAWMGLAQYHAVMFVSANAVHAFAAARPAACAWVGATRAWATGPGTAQALLDAGVDPACIDAPAADAAQFDSEALWDCVAHQPLAGARVLIVRGADAEGRQAGRPWLADRLALAQAQVDTVVAYGRGVPQWDDAQLAVARAGASDGAVWLFSSSDAVRHLALLLPGQAWNQARAVATHPRIAQAALALGFGRVQASRPGLDDLLASIESFG
jgi:uroporphyrinogen-III synthase